MLRNHGIEVQTHDVVLRYFRIRVGDDAIHLDSPKALQDYAGGTGEHALYFIEGSKNCIADHLSLSWSTTKILSVTKLSDLITIQWCILSEALNFAGHGYASIAGGNRVPGITISSPTTTAGTFAFRAWWMPTSATM